MIASADAPIATVDATVFSIEDGALKLLLHRRPEAPFAGQWALPGGFIHTQEDRDAEHAVRRVLKQKTGTAGYYLEQLATYTGPDRDPRGWSLSVAYLALVARHALGPGLTENVALFPVDDLPSLAFDHDDIVAGGLARLRGKGVYSTLPVSLLADEFTLSEAQRAYEAVLGTGIDHSSFRRKVLELGIFEETGNSRQGANKRPAKLFRLRGRGQTFDRSLGRTAV